MKNLKSIILLLLTLTVVLTCVTSCAVLDAFESLFPGRHVHTFADATCTAPKTCECGATEGEALGHNAIEVFGKAPTCTEPGQTNFVYCDVCGENLSTAEEIAPLGHTFVEGKCECGAEDPNYVPPHEHSYTPVVTAPTCTEAGFTTYTCACGDSYKADEVAALGHKHTTVVTAPTCTEAGFTTYTCACGDTYKADEVPATGHDYKEVVTKPDCVNGGYTTHTCETCGDSYTDSKTDALGHNPGEVTIENKKDADFDNDGSYDEVVYCTVCQAELSRKTVTIPAIAGVAQIGEQPYATLQAAIDAATAGQTIKLLANITEGVTINKAVVIDGAGFTVLGTVTVEGHADVETVQFVNVKFVTDAAETSAICVNINRDAEVIFDGCDFTSTSSDRYYNGCKAIKISFDCTVEIKNCTASKMYYMVDAQQSIDTTLTVDNCTLTDMVYGIGAYRCVNVVIKDFTYTGMSYSINVQNIATSLTLENVNVNQPIKMDAHLGETAGTYVINLKGTNVYNGTEILPKNDDVWFERENADDPYIIKHIDHIPGEETIKNEVAPNCTTPGSYDKVVYCTKCDVELSRETVTEGDALGHADTNKDFKCDACGTKVIPAAGTTFTLEEAIKLSKLYAHNTYTTGKYYITATVTDVYNTQYGNMYVTDGTNTFTVYGTYSADGKIRYDAMSYKPVAGDVVTFYGVIGTYSNAAQMKNAWITEVVPHECDYTVAATCTKALSCSKCGAEKDGEVALGHDAPAATCTEASICARCNTMLENVLGHAFAEGVCTRCGETQGDAPAIVQTTASKTVKELIAQYGWTDTTTKQSFNLDDVVSVKINGGSNTGKAYNGDHIRIYATDSPAGTMTISVAAGYELVSIKITTQTGTYAYLYVDGTTTNICNKTVEVDGSSVLLKSVKNGSNGKQVRVMAIEVVYQNVG